jgi:hypothetical protein
VDGLFDPVGSGYADEWAAREWIRGRVSPTLTVGTKASTHGTNGLWRRCNRPIRLGDDHRSPSRGCAGSSWRKSTGKKNREGS